MIPAVAVCGEKNSGKTTLCAALLEGLRRRGVRTGFLKHTCEDVRSPAVTDTGRIGQSGFDTALWGSDGVRFEPAGAFEDWPAVAARLFPFADLLLIEGGKGLAAPKIWVGAAAPSEIRGVFLRYDRAVPGDGEKIFGVGMEDLLAGRIAAMALPEPARAMAGDRQIPMKDFVAEFLRGGTLGMLAALKGGPDPGEDVRVFVPRRTRGSFAPPHETDRA
jgi:molybdopterin-guanine dinucleotide biosynthesis protein B